MGDFKISDDFLHAPGNLFRTPAIQAQACCEVDGLLDSQFRMDDVILGNIANHGAKVFIVLDQIQTEDFHSAFRGQHLAVEDFQEGGFSAPRGAHDRGHNTRLNFNEGRMECALAGLVIEGHPVPNHGHLVG